LRILALGVRKLLTSPRAAVLQARMAFWVVVVSLVARVASLSRAHRLASFRFRHGRGGGPSPLELARAVDGVLALDLFVLRRSCWRRAMVLHRFLALNGIDSRINFGIRKAADGGVAGHAWLERDGQPFLEDDASGPYTVTFSLPRAQGAAPVLTDRPEWDRP
jgi:hypothetical protein